LATARSSVASRIDDAQSSSEVSKALCAMGPAEINARRRDTRARGARPSADLMRQARIRRHEAPESDVARQRIGSPMRAFSMQPSPVRQTSQADSHSRRFAPPTRFDGDLVVPPFDHRGSFEAKMFG
jgi:hypothetical protein